MSGAVSAPSSGAAPPVERLVHRLAACPDAFLAPPRIGDAGVVSVGAVLGDAVRARGAELPEAWLDAVGPAVADAGTERWLRAVLVTCWLVADDELDGLVGADALLGLLTADLRALTDLVAPEDLVGDDDRREELARLLLRSCGVVPAGETEGQAADRLATLDSVSRTRVEAEARAAEQRAREVREAMERRRAAEAAARASRE